MNIMLDEITSGQTKENELNYVQKEILENDKPNVWNIYQPENMERVLEVDFHKYAISVTENTGQDLSKLTVFSFYASVEHLKEKFKSTKKNHG